MKVKRTDRLDSVYQQEISKIVSQSLKNKQPEMSGIVSIVEAKVAPDLKNATIYVSIYANSDEKKNRTFEIICENAGYIRHELSKVMQMRTVPVLHFVLDDSMSYGSHIDEILSKLDIKPAEEDEDDDEQ